VVVTVKAMAENRRNLFIFYLTYKMDLFVASISHMGAKVILIGKEKKKSLDFFSE
jgi:hypothetical protein